MTFNLKCTATGLWFPCAVSYTHLCESAGTQTGDAALMQEMYRKNLEKAGDVYKRQILDRNYVAEMNKVFDNGYDIPVSYTHLDVYKRQGYYSVRFSLSQEDNTEAFLTGLSDTNVDLVQEEMVNAAIENSQFSMEALDFIDAEKTNLPEDGDDLHCWAATTANMLHYTCLLYTS